LSNSKINVHAHQWTRTQTDVDTVGICIAHFYHSKSF